MGRKVKPEPEIMGSSPNNAGAKKPPANKKTAKKRGAHDSDSEDDDIELHRGPHGLELEFELPPKDVMTKLIDNIEAQLPREDHVKYDSRAKKLDWEKIKFDFYTGDQCKKMWYYVQDRIRRFRIMQELIPDARTWISQPWTNFYKSKDHNRHPDMPKKPLSMYMLFYSEKREQILKENPTLSMPEVAKICSEQYQKLSDKKKSRYKQRCDEMRRLYEEKLANFYANYPDLKPVKAEKSKKPKVTHPPMGPPGGMHPGQHPDNAGTPPSQVMNQINANNAIPMMTYQQQQVQQPQVITIGSGPNQQMINVLPMQDQGQVYTVVSQGQQLPQQPLQPPISQHQPMPQQQQYKQPSPVPHQTQNLQQQQNQPPPQAQQFQQQQTPQQQIQQQNAAYPAAPEKPAKPFDLFFKGQMDMHTGDSNFDRQSYAEQCRQEWKNMKLKKKAKWIKKANDNYREYEEKITEFMAQNPGYVRPQHKNFLTQDDQRILDKFMGRPEKPPSSAYSLFSKEMLNNIEIKKFPSKERMAQISEKWKLLPQQQKDNYQAEVNRSMGVYRQKYEDWFNNLNEQERKAETARMNSTKSIRKQPAKNNAVQAAQAAQAAAAASNIGSGGGQTTTTSVIHEPKIVNVPSNVTPAGPAFSITNLTPISVMQAGVQPQPVQMSQMMPQPVTMQVSLPPAAAAATTGPATTTKDRQSLLDEILKREPVEPARSPKQLFVAEYLLKHKKKKQVDAKAAWKALEKKEKKKWHEKLEPQRQKYIEDYTVFVRGLDKEELEMYTELKQKRDEEEESQNDSSDSESDTSESDDSDSESDSDSDS